MGELKDRFEISKREGTDFILTPEDLAIGIDNEGKEIKTIDDLVMVHITNYMPNGAIKSPRSTGKKITYEEYSLIGGKKFSFPIAVSEARNSVHFCLNGKVSPHMNLPLYETKYAVLMPLSTNKEKIVAGTECDLFTIGDVPIKNDAYILCTESEMERVKIANPDATVIGCKGDFVDPYVNVFLSQILGYKYEEPQQNSRFWGKAGNPNKDHDIVESIIKSNGWEITDHNGSKWDERDRFEQDLETLMQYINIVRDNKFLYDKSNIIDVYKFIDGPVHFIASDYQDKSLRKEIYDFILNKTGINIEILDKLKDSDDKFAVFYAEICPIMTSAIVKGLREQALQEKEQLGILSEAEKIGLLYNHNVGDFDAFCKDKNNIEIVNCLNSLDELEDKNLDDLSPEELKQIMAIINFKFDIIFGEKNNYSARIDESKAMEELLTNSKSSAPKSIILGIQHVGRILLNDDSQKEYMRFYEEVVKSTGDITGGEKLTDYQKKIFEYPGSHIKVGKSGVVNTDFDSDNCKTVKDLIIATTNYISQFNALYNGQNVKFDQYGKSLTESVDKEHEKQQNLEQMLNKDSVVNLENSNSKTM